MNLSASRARALIGAAALSLGMVALPAVAHASSLSVTNNGTTLSYTGAAASPPLDPGEANDVTISFVASDPTYGQPAYQVTDPGVAPHTITAVPPQCFAQSASTAYCFATGITSMSVDVNDNNDIVRIDPTVGAIPATLNGGAGADYLYGGPGNDTLIGGSGDDFETGGNGNDVYDAGSSSDGADTLGKLPQHAGPHQTDPAVAADPGVDTVDYSARSNPVTVTTGDATANDGEGGGAPTPVGEGDNVDSSLEDILGGSGGDTISGADGVDNALNGGAGGDTLNGLGGSDTLTGGAGNDTETGGSGDDTFDEGNAANGADTLTGGGDSGDAVDYSKRTNAVLIDLRGTSQGSGENEGQSPPSPSQENDTITGVNNASGGSGNDTIIGNGSTNTLNGGNGNDSIDGGAGSGDVLNGEAGNDNLSGGSGISGGANQSPGTILNGGPGTDTADYSNRGDNTGPDLSLSDDGQPDSGETAKTANTNTAEGDTIGTDVENLTAGAGDDVLTGNNLGNVLTPGRGSDTIHGGNGVDTANYGDSGHDGDLVLSLDGTSTDDDGQANEDATSDTGDNAHNLDAIDVDVENMSGGPNNDQLTGDGGPNVLNGRSGDDILNGGDGDDSLIGGPGPALTQSGATSDNDTFNGGPGADTADYSGRSAALTITIDDQANDGQAAQNGGVVPAEADNVQTSVENVIGGSAGDTITGSSADNVLNGGPGDDTLTGGAGNDTFPQGTAYDGADVTHGGDGFDRVDYSLRTAAVTATPDAKPNDGASTGEGDNVGPDIERIDGGSGGDNLSAGSGGGYTLNGNGGDDKINSREDPAKADTVDCGPGNDVATSDNLDTLSNCENSDVDGDGVIDSADNCPSVANADQADQDKDGVGDACDPDIDGDGVTNSTDNCPTTVNADQKDTDKDGKGDACDDDVDGDGVANGSDNCPSVSNANQADQDKDGKGDACDSDIDGDGVANSSDACPTTPAATANGCPTQSDKTPPVITLSVPASAARLKAVLAHGLVATAGCNEPCALTGRLTISRALARKLHAPTTLGSGTLSLRSGGSGKLDVKLTRAAKRALGRTRMKKIAAKLSVRAVDASSNLSATSKPVTLRR